MSLFADVPVAAVLSEAQRAFEVACEALPVHVRHVRFADQHLRLELVGDAALASFIVPFTPEPHPEGVPDLTLRVWDATTPGAQLSPPMLPDARCLEPRALFADAAISGRGGGPEQVEGHPIRQVFWEPFWVFGFDLDQRVAWFHGREVSPAWSLAHPFIKLLHPWLRTRAVHIVHAGAVGDESGCALIIGPGGSGKSTLTIASRLAGLTYLGDDYVAVRLARPQAAARAFGLYRIAKLVPAHMRALLPEVEAHRLADDGAKSRLVLDVTHPDGLPVVAIVIPEVIPGTTRADPYPVSSAEALRMLAPSTLFQLPGYPEDLASLAALVRRAPAHRLPLGSDLAAAAASVRALVTARV